MFDCGPGTCSLEVCLNAGKISAGKRGIQDWQGFDGNKVAFILKDLPSNPCQS